MIINTTFLHDVLISLQTLLFLHDVLISLQTLLFHNIFSHIKWEIPIIHETSQFQISHNAVFFP